MSELSELYQQVILDHHHKPHNFRVLESANRKAEGYNPLCGDEITVYLKVADGVIEDISFQGSGCAISRASASLMTTRLKGATVAQAEDLFAKLHRLVTAESEEAQDSAALGKLAVLAGVRAFPSRVKCASLAWHTMRAALDAKQEVVSTE